MSSQQEVKAGSNLSAQQDKSEIFLQGMVEAFAVRARKFLSEATDPKDKVKRVTEIKNEIRKITHKDLTIEADEYSSCQPPNQCVGGVCIDGNLPVKDSDFSSVLFPGRGGSVS